MSVEKARAHYIGKGGCQRLNCAQTVVHAFKDKFGFSGEDVVRFAGCGGGRAPLGECGALKCREIRSTNKLSCVGCVEKMAECLEQV